MSENNQNEADALFATRRKKQQDEEALKAAKIAEEERIAELERQKQQVAEEIKRLETLQAIQKEQEEKKALEEKATQEALNAEKATKAAKGEKAPFDIKKYLPFIIGGAALIIVVVIIVLVLSNSGKKRNAFSTMIEEGNWYRATDEESGLTYVYPSVFEECDEGYYYFDNESEQGVFIEVVPSLYDAEAAILFESEDLMKFGLTAMMEAEEAKDYTFNKRGENIYYAANSFDKENYDGGIYAVVIGRNDDYCLEVYFNVDRNTEGYPRNIDIEDLLNMYEIMLDHISAG